jgi:hypothetical protein
MFKISLLTTVGFAAVGFVLGAVSYEIGDKQTYDLWTHSVGIGLDFGIVGFLLVVACKIAMNIWRKR